MSVRPLASRIEDRRRRAVARIEQGQHTVFRGPAGFVVIDEIAHHLDPGGIDLAADPAAQHVEVALRSGARFQMHARLDHRLAPALHGQAALDGGQDLGIGQRQRLDVEAVEVGDVDRRGGGVLGHGGLYGDSRRQRNMTREAGIWQLASTGV
jgi:hypothetical protein